jgi:CRISPR/Cas system CSM-associated protein Csm3 (group 7 of RAMP superfamily)
MENLNHYSHRLLARIVIQAETPLSVGSGDDNVFTDRLVSRDVNRLPYIPGTAIAGVIRHAVEEKDNVQFFGYGGNKEDHGKGSEIIFSSAQIVDADGTVIEGLHTNQESDYLQHFDNLPVRQHVRMNDKGAAEDHGKFDEEVVYKGTRFCFEMEMVASDNDTANFNKVLVLSELASDTIRIGGGTRKGFGEISIVECKQKILDLSNETDLTGYIEKTSSLNDRFWNNINPDGKKTDNSEGWTTYKLELKPDDFFLFGSGFGNENADMTAVSETYIDWSSGKPEFKDNAVLIPGSSVKGALSHRVAFHYNKIKKYYAGNPEAKTDVDNPAVQALFGYTRKVTDAEGKEKEELQRGNVLISDVIQVKEVEQEKILNHVSIDRFTGGAIDGALFSEEVTYGNGAAYTLTFKVKNDALEKDTVKQAFEAALTDITVGMLPLGGGINRGHGCFSGIIYKNNEPLKQS